MAIKLSDAQLVLMSAAAQREDRCLVASQQLKGGGSKKVAEKLIGAGLVKEVRAKAETPVWWRDEEGRGFALKLTAAGLKAIAVEEEAGGDGGASDQSAARASNRSAKPGDGNGEGAAIVRASPGREMAPLRPASKLAAVIGLMQRGEGATIDELTAATGWLPHTTRAAITGLRKRNFEVFLDKADKGRGSVYRIVAPDSVAVGGSGGAPDVDAPAQADPVSAAAYIDAAVAPSETTATHSRRRRKPASDRLAA